MYGSSFTNICEMTERNPEGPEIDGDKSFDKGVLSNEIISPSPKRLPKFHPGAFGGKVPDDFHGFNAAVDWTTVMGRPILSSFNPRPNPSVPQSLRKDLSVDQESKNPEDPTSNPVYALLHGHPRESSFEGTHSGYSSVQFMRHNIQIGSDVLRPRSHWDAWEDRPVYELNANYNRGEDGQVSITRKGYNKSIGESMQLRKKLGGDFSEGINPIVQDYQISTLPISSKPQSDGPNLSGPLDQTSSKQLQNPILRPNTSDLPVDKLPSFVDSRLPFEKLQIDKLRLDKLSFDKLRPQGELNTRGSRSVILARRMTYPPSGRFRGMVFDGNMKQKTKDVIDRRVQEQYLETPIGSSSNLAELGKRLLKSTLCLPSVGKTLMATPPDVKLSFAQAATKKAREKNSRVERKPGRTKPNWENQSNRQNSSEAKPHELNYGVKLAQYKVIILVQRREHSYELAMSPTPKSSPDSLFPPHHTSGPIGLGISTPELPQTTTPTMTVQAPQAIDPNSQNQIESSRQLMTKLRFKLNPLACDFQPASSRVSDCDNATGINTANNGPRLSYGSQDARNYPYVENRPYVAYPVDNSFYESYGPRNGYQGMNFLSRVLGQDTELAGLINHPHSWQLPGVPTGPAYENHRRSKNYSAQGSFNKTDGKFDYSQTASPQMSPALSTESSPPIQEGGTYLSIVGSDFVPGSTYLRQYQQLQSDNYQVQSGYPFRFNWADDVDDRNGFMHAQHINIMTHGPGAGLQIFHRKPDAQEDPVYMHAGNITWLTVPNPEETAQSQKPQTIPEEAATEAESHSAHDDAHDHGISNPEEIQIVAQDSQFTPSDPELEVFAQECPSQAETNQAPQSDASISCADTETPLDPVPQVSDVIAMIEQLSVVEDVTKFEDAPKVEDVPKVVESLPVIKGNTSMGEESPPIRTTVQGQPKFLSQPPSTGKEQSREVKAEKVVPETKVSDLRDDPSVWHHVSSRKKNKRPAVIIAVAPAVSAPVTEPSRVKVANNKDGDPKYGVEAPKPATPVPAPVASQNTPPIVHRPMVMQHRKLYVSGIPETMNYEKWMSLIRGGLIDDTFISGLSPDYVNHTQTSRRASGSAFAANQPWFGYITFYTPEGAQNYIRYLRSIDPQKGQGENKVFVVAHMVLDGKRVAVQMRDNDQRIVSSEIVTAVEERKATRVLMFTFKQGIGRIAHKNMTRGDYKMRGDGNSIWDWKTWLKAFFGKDGNRAALEHIERQLQIWGAHPKVYYDSIRVLPKETVAPVKKSTVPKTFLGPNTNEVVRVVISFLRISSAEKVKSILETHRDYFDHCAITYCEDPCNNVEGVPPRPPTPPPSVISQQNGSQGSKKGHYRDGSASNGHFGPHGNGENNKNFQRNGNGMNGGQAAPRGPTPSGQQQSQAISSNIEPQIMSKAARKRAAKARRLANPGVVDGNSFPSLPNSIRGGRQNAANQNSAAPQWVRSPPVLSRVTSPVENSAPTSVASPVIQEKVTSWADDFDDEVLEVNTTKDNGTINAAANGINGNSESVVAEATKTQTRDEVQKASEPEKSSSNGVNSKA